jgi:hypothetical protein
MAELFDMKKFGDHFGDYNKSRLPNLLKMLQYVQDFDGFSDCIPPR